MLAKLTTYALVGIDACRSKSKWTPPTGCPRPFSSDCRRPPSRRACIASSGPWLTLAINGPAGVRSSTWRRPICARTPAGFDLPIALGMLVATGQLLPEHVQGWAMIGELALEGSVRAGQGGPVDRDGGQGGGHHPAHRADAEWPRGRRRRRRPRLRRQHALRSGRPPHRAGHADADPGRRSRTCSRSSIITTSISPTCVARNTPSGPSWSPPAGGHNVLMIGTPGSGKTMLTRRLPTILPPLTPSESLETTRIYSAMGRLAPGEALLATRPFRSPHHTIQRRRHGRRRHHPDARRNLAGPSWRPLPRRVARIQSPQPRSPAATPRRGEGDDLARPQFVHLPRQLRPRGRDEPVPLRLHGRSQAHVQMLADADRTLHGPHLRPACWIASTCTSKCRRSRIRSWPPGRTAHPARPCARRCEQARDVQMQRFGGEGQRLNSRMTSRQLRKHCVLDAECQGLMQTAMDSLGLSARAHDRILRVARTIADLEGSGGHQAHASVARRSAIAVWIASCGPVRDRGQWNSVCDKMPMACPDLEESQ